jgi:hypothetical protein
MLQLKMMLGKNVSYHGDKFRHLFNKYLLKTYDVPDSTLGVKHEKHSTK